MTKKSISYLFDCIFGNPYEKEQPFEDFYREYYETPQSLRYWRYQRKYAKEEIMTIIISFVLPLIGAWLEATKQY